MRRILANLAYRWFRWSDRLFISDSTWHRLYDSTTNARGFD